MSFLFYFAVLLFTAASAVFGLDLMTAPLPKHHAKPQVADTAVPSRSRATDQGNKVAVHDDDEASSGRALSPVYPAAPKPPPGSAAEQQHASPQQTATVQPGQDSAAPSATNPPPSAETTGANSADAALAAEPGTPADGEPAAQPAAERTSSLCNIQACSSAYHSFNASDCTFQPYEGPRRLCTKGQASPQRAASQPRQEQRHGRFGGQARADDPGLRGGGRRTRATRNWYDDDYDDAPLFAGRGRRGLFGFPAGSNDYWR